MRVYNMKKFITIFIVLSMIHFINSFPIESLPLKNNPESWNFGIDSSDVKKSKITPKSIFIAPSNSIVAKCSHGFRVDDDGKCIKIFQIDQDQILAARIHELFGINENPNENSDIDSDYYDDSGPLQINIPLVIDESSKKIEYVVEEKVVMRNLNPNLLITTESIEESSTSTEFYSTEGTEGIIETSTQYTTDATTDVTTTKDDELTTSTSNPSTLSIVSVTNKGYPSKTTTETSVISTTKLFSVDFLPKSFRKTNKNQAQLKSSKNRHKKQKSNSTKLSKDISKNNQIGFKKLAKPKFDITSERTTESFWWLPKGWVVENEHENPVLVRFRSQSEKDGKIGTDSQNRRTNSRMKIF